MYIVLGAGVCSSKCKWSTQSFTSLLKPSIFSCFHFFEEFSKDFSALKVNNSVMSHDLISFVKVTTSQLHS